MALEIMVLRIFQREVERQCKFALIAAGDLDNVLQRGDMDRIWYSVQALLVAVGNISKLLWPPKPAIPQRGEELRCSLGVPDNSILEPRVFRNHFEHFDERLENWATSSARRNFVDSNVGPRNMITGIDDADFLRNLDTSDWSITFRGDSYDLKSMIEAVRHLWDRAAKEASKPHWDKTEVTRT